MLNKDLPLYQSFHMYHLIGKHFGLSILFLESWIINNSYWVLIIGKGWVWCFQSIILLWAFVQMFGVDSIITFIIKEKKLIFVRLKLLPELDMWHFKLSNPHCPETWTNFPVVPWQGRMHHVGANILPSKKTNSEKEGGLLPSPSSFDYTNVTH